MACLMINDSCYRTQKCRAVNSSGAAAPWHLQNGELRHRWARDGAGSGPAPAIHMRNKDAKVTASPGHLCSGGLAQKYGLSLDISIREDLRAQ